MMDEKIYAITQLVLVAAAYAGTAIWMAAHIIRGDIDTLGGYALCMALLLALRWLTIKSYGQLRDIGKE